MNYEVINGVTKYILDSDRIEYNFPIAFVVTNSSNDTAFVTPLVFAASKAYTFELSEITDPKGATTIEQYVDILAIEGAFSNAIAEGGGGSGSISFEENLVIVKSASDLSTVDFTKTYKLDGIVDLSTIDIVVPLNSVFELIGDSSDLSGMTSTKDNHTFVSGQGQFKYSGVSFRMSGVNAQVFSMQGAGSSAEGTNTNFFDCKIGTANGTRQIFLQNTFWNGCTDGIDFIGANGGAFIDSTRIINFNPADDVGKSCFSADVGATFSSRFRSNANIDSDSNSTAYAFAPSNFLANGLFQLQGGQIAGTGNKVVGITENDIQSDWNRTNGLKDTNIGAFLEYEVSTPITIVASDVYQKVELPTIAKKLTYHSQPSNSTIRYLGESPIDQAITGNITFRGGNNKQVTFDVRVNGVSVFFATETTDGNGRARNVVIFGYNETLKDEDIEVFVKTLDGSNITIDRFALRCNKE